MSILNPNPYLTMIRLVILYFGSYLNRFLLIVLLIFNGASFGRTNFYKVEGPLSIQKKYSDQYIRSSYFVGELVKRDTSKHRFINKITIYAGVINYWGISNFERHYNSIFGSFYLSLTSNKKNIAFKLGEIRKPESIKLNPNSKDGFAAGNFSFMAFSKCFYFKKINYNLGVAGSYCSLYYYPNSEIDYVGAGTLFDVSINITKMFSVNGFYINSLYLRNGLKIDNYFSIGVGINFYRR